MHLISFVKGGIAQICFIHPLLPIHLHLALCGGFCIFSTQVMVCSELLKNGDLRSYLQAMDLRYVYVSPCTHH